MHASNLFSSRVSSLITLPTLLVLSAVLTGCMGGVVTSSTYAVASGTAAKLHEERQAFREDLKDDYGTYKEILSESGCNPSEYEISPEILEHMRKSAAGGDVYAKTQETLMEIYRDPTVTRDVRAHALYVASLAEAQKEDGSNEKAREYLKWVKQEFPGTHDCAVDTLLEEGSKID
ncbi:hypothetical protein [Marinobacter salicampi]|uniref:hypothetical protein n=1 Tax=Marinobacter salicampi TaxID=435907 RepID=UPI00140D7C05|nr:hypothetical protein [Marinobacter salicampi]